MNEPELRPMFSYSLGMIVLVILLIGLILYFIFKPKQKKVQAPVVVLPEIKSVFSIKEKHIRQLDQLQAEITLGNITNRKAYHRISSIIRHFIFEMTQIKVQNYSLAEIRKLNMPVLTSLVEEYYDPEFAKESKGDALESLKKTREVIERWN